MKTSINNLSFLPTLIAGLGLMLTGQLNAQTLTTLYNFTGGSDGTRPEGLILSGNILYGTAVEGGSGNGTVFAVNTDGSGFTNLHSFTGGNDGARPNSGLILSSNILYGMANNGGGSGNGTVFAINSDGSGFTTLYGFTARSGSSATNNDGAHPYGGLILSGNTLYGTVNAGGVFGRGTVFAVNTDGTGFTTLHSFTGGSDGANPYTGLILSSNTLYGTAGHVFAINTNGTGFRILHSLTGSDGNTPRERLILSGNTLYGTAAAGGTSGWGTVFAVNTDGTDFTPLYSFTATSAPLFINSDGAQPLGGVILSGNILYGTATRGGTSGYGTVFAVNTDGIGFTNLYSFAGGNDGANPSAGLILSGSTLYGTAHNGGSSGAGTVFSLSLPSVSGPQLTLAPDGSGGYFIRAQGDPNFTCRLQRAPDLSGPWDTLDTQTAPDSGLIEFHDTIPLPGQAFYRTLQP